MKNGVRVPTKDLGCQLAIMIAIAAGLLTGAAVAMQASAAQDSTTTITIDNFTFAPPMLTVPIGTVVTWVNRDDIPHTVVEKNKARFERFQ